METALPAPPCRGARLCSPPPPLRPRKNTHHPAAEYNGAPHPSLCRGRTQPRPSVFSGANMGAFIHSPELPTGHAAAFRSIYARTVHATSIAPMLPQKRSYPGRISIPDTGLSEIRLSSSGQKDAVAVVEEVGVVVRGDSECGGEAQVVHAFLRNLIGGEGFCIALYKATAATCSTLRT